jgi:hypothetical protein
LIALRLEELGNNDSLDADNDGLLGGGTGTSLSPAQVGGSSLAKGGPESKEMAAEALHRDRSKDKPKEHVKDKPKDPPKDKKKKPQGSSLANVKYKI